ncbi:hypothetical protein GCM10027295_23390 [Pseudaeromonas pectinilytica]
MRSALGIGIDIRLGEQSDADGGGLGLAIADLNIRVHEYLPQFSQRATSAQQAQQSGDEQEACGELPPLTVSHRGYSSTLSRKLGVGWG